MGFNVGEGNHVFAIYNKQRLPKYCGNRFIEALPPSLDADALKRQLWIRPEFSEEQRTWTQNERCQLALGLSNIMIPSARHVSLAQMLDNMIREGYAARPSSKAEMNVLVNQIYASQKKGEAFTQKGQNSSGTSLTKVLLGYSGIGKTSAVNAAMSLLPPVIQHPDEHLQITSIRVETPHDGSNIRGFCFSIFRQVDQLIGTDYQTLYGQNSRASIEMLLNQVVLVLNTYSVGLLICDEIQNLENAHRGKQNLMTFFVSLSNELGIPILFIGTNKARSVFELDFRQARRSCNVGPSTWDRMETSSEQGAKEWHDFLSNLWAYQWVQKPISLSDALSEQLYEMSQGITDVLIKLFISAQTRAIQSGVETLSLELFLEVCRNELAPLRPMLDAMRNNNVSELERYSDITPVNLASLKLQSDLRNEGLVAVQSFHPPKSKHFEPQLCAQIQNLGVNEDIAGTLAKSIVENGSPNDMHHAVELALVELKPSKTPRFLKAGIPSSDANIEFDAKDLRRSLAEAKAGGQPCLSLLVQNGHVTNVIEKFRL